MKHTKGKWMVAISGINTIGENKYQVVANIPHCGVMGDDNETPVCNISQFNSNEEAKANAKLIAAAPELLEVAINALADLEGIMPVHDPDGDRTHSAWETIKELNQAIKKATNG